MTRMESEGILFKKEIFLFLNVKEPPKVLHELSIPDGVPWINLSIWNDQSLMRWREDSSWMEEINSFSSKREEIKQTENAAELPKPDPI
jgi:hypothetical protein